jgi:FkbM family methyltransferase
LIFNALWFKGIYDLTTSETIWRLLDEEEVALDVGAHIGYMTSLMAIRCGPGGQVFSFEPHPTLFRELKINIELWSEYQGIAQVNAVNIALSDQDASAFLKIPAHWEVNRGVAQVVTTEENVADQASFSPIKLKRLDHVLNGHLQVALMKLDVEGHELAVLRGAENFLSRGKIRDIIFEDVNSYPSSSMLFLEKLGYTLFSLAKHFRGPQLYSPDRNGVSPRDDPNYLATLDPERAIWRMRKKGWNVLREKRSPEVVK